MARICIKNFSCIDDACVELSRLTVLIGPQASGKSVISKLTYFFYDSLLELIGYKFDLEELSFVEFEKEFLENFKKFFPPQAWGTKAFEVSFEAGPILIKVYRSKPRKTSSGVLKVEFSEQYKEIFDFIQSEQKSVKVKSANSARESLSTSWKLFWRIRQAARIRLQNDLGDDFVNSQLFVPAGRSFFTSMGKAVVAFEHGGFLDPLTVTFGKSFLAMRDQISGRTTTYRSPGRDKQQREMQALRDDLSLQLFSGVIKIEKNDEYIESSDGRRIPFSMLSSGQQELLPLWLTIDDFMNVDSPNTLIYIEEPEAHLFPAAQGVLTEYLATLLGAVNSQRMVITTHSPYILSKINNLLKAGALASRSIKKDQSLIENIVPRPAWLKPKTTAAYAIINRRVVDIMGDDGFIDGEYLDEVSGQIARDFSRLLEIEYAR